jgi:hypothetical protein
MQLAAWNFSENSCILIHDSEFTGTYGEHENVYLAAAFFTRTHASIYGILDLCVSYHKKVVIQSI